MMDVGNDSDWEDEVQDGLCQLPPGEEVFLQSHAGGEDVLQAVMDGITFWRVLAQGLQSIKIYILLLIYASLIKGITSIDKGQ